MQKVNRGVLKCADTHSLGPKSTCYFGILMFKTPRPNFFSSFACNRWTAL